MLAIRAFSHWDEWQDSTDHVVGTGAYVAVGTVIGSSMYGNRSIGDRAHAIFRICSTLLLAVLTLFGNSAKYQTPNTSFLPG